MPEDTNNTSNLPATPPLVKTPLTNHQNLFLLIVLGLSLLLNVVMLVVYSQEKTKEVPYVDMSLAIPPSDEYHEEGNSVEDPVVEDSTYTPQSGSTLTPDPTDYSIFYKNLIKQPGVSWLEKPISMGDLKLVEPKNSDSGPLNYYQIGTRDNNPIVFVSTPCDGMCFAHMIFVIDSEQKAVLIKNNSVEDLDSEWSMVKLASGVTIDAIYKFDALLPDLEMIPNATTPKIKIGNWLGQSLEFFSETGFNLSTVQPETKVEYIKDTEWGPLFRSYTVSEVGTVDYYYAIRLPGGLSVSYDEAPLDYMTDDRVPQITWQDGGVNTEPYRGDRLSGCGGGGPEVLVEPLKEPKIERVGTTKTGEVVYNVIDVTHPLITRIFEMTDGVVYEYNQQTGVSTNRVITPAEFVAKRGVLLVESLGRQLVYTNTKYGPQAECGKPVIYLYPEATTTVSVSVDALITKSEPVYGEAGWLATAHPDGSLIVNGQPYTSLFWDGYGNGVYPEIKQGFVVPTSRVLEVMSDHLRYIGFNTFEISEFVAFWSDHLPQEPYTRFSWLQTREMESLARLTITPKPDTLIRAFVDYEGVDEMSEIEPQKLIKRERNGYVVTEWGGLLRK